MEKIKVLAGDFLEGDGFFSETDITLSTEEESKSPEEVIPLSEIETLEIATEENVKKIGGTIGWGAAGAVLLGPAGLLAGLLLGGRQKEVTFVARFKDGRKLLASTRSKSFTILQAATF